MRYVIIINLILLSLLLSGCATTSTIPHTVVTAPSPQLYPKGIYHTVLAGQTLWRIAKAYDTDILVIIEANQITDASKIETGQTILIPGAVEPIKGELMPPPKKSIRGYIWPIEGRIISYYGSKKDNLISKGIDIEAQQGQMIVASRSGRVVFCDDKVKGLGRVIIIDHGDGYSTLYANNSENLIQCGDYVRQNQPIAKAGRSGRAKRPMLHFQIRKGHKPQNPFYYLP